MALAVLAPSKQVGSPQMEGDVSYVGAHILRKVCSFFSLNIIIVYTFFADCPQNTGPLINHRSAGTGANSAPTGSRQWGESREKDTWRDRDGGWGDKANRRERPPVDDEYRSRGVGDEGRIKGGDYHDDRSGRMRLRSRSRSPGYRSNRRDGHGQKERRRSHSREQSGDHDYRDKRRRID